MKRTIVFVYLSILFVCCGHPPESPSSTSEKITDQNRIKVAVTILPQKYFVQQIGGTDIDIQVMIPPGYSPATYSPTPGQIRKLTEVTIYFKVGHLPFEIFWMDKIKSAAPNMEIIDTSVGIQLLKAHDHHYHEISHEKSSSGIDPHTWLSPMAVKKQCETIKNALLKIIPTEDVLILQKNHDRFMAAIDQLDLEMKVTFKPIRNQTILVFHPAWGYLARDYGLSQLPIESEGKEPTPRRLIHLIKEAGIKKNPVIFVQKQFDQHSAKAIGDEINGEVIVLDPLAENWLKNMREMSRIIGDHLYSVEKTHSHE